MQHPNEQPLFDSKRRLRSMHRMSKRLVARTSSDMTEDYSRYSSIHETMDRDESYGKRRGRIRYLLCVMLFFSCFVVYAMRINLSVAIVAMVNVTTVDNAPLANESCRSGDVGFSSTQAEDYATGEFDWSEGQQATITYSFFVGYLLMQIPGGYMAERFSVTWVLALGVGLTSVLTCVTSIAVRYHFYAFILLRILEGLGEGVVYPCVFVFISSWVPIEEQSFLLNFVLAGSVAGTVVTMPLSAMLSKSALGWPASFYVFGLIGIVWSLIWLAVAADGPEYHRWISHEEHVYIIQRRPAVTNKLEKVPWKQMLLCPQILLLGLMKLGVTMNLYMILIELPNYLKSMFDMEIVNNGLINGLMNLGLGISLVVSGILVDKIIAQELFSRNFIRKVFVACSTLIPSVCLCIVPLLRCQRDLVLSLLLINCIFLGLMGGGDSAISLDLAPKYAGTVQGIVNLIGNFAGVFAPQLVGTMTEGNNTINQWNMVFWCTAIFTAVTSIIFLIFGSTKQQKWAEDSSDEEGLYVVDSPKDKTLYDRIS